MHEFTALYLRSIHAPLCTRSGKSLELEVRAPRQPRRDGVLTADLSLGPEEILKDGKEYTTCKNDSCTD